MDETTKGLLLNLASEGISILFTVTILSWFLDWNTKRKWRPATDVAHTMLWDKTYQLITVLYETIGLDTSNPHHGEFKIINFYGEALEFFRYETEIFANKFRLTVQKTDSNTYWEDFLRVAAEVKPSIDDLVARYAFLLDAELLGYLLAFNRYFEKGQPRRCALAIWQAHRILRDKGEVMSNEKWHEIFILYTKKRPLHRLFEFEDLISESRESNYTHQ